LPIYDCYQSTEQLTQQQAKQQLGLEGKNVLLFFGYVRKYKGLMNLIEAMPLIKDGAQNPHLLIVGEFYDDPQPYYDAINRLGLDNNITIVNKYVANETVHLYFTAASLVVLPYNEATQSGILSIAYGFAKPVVVTNVGGLAELVDDGTTGYIGPPHDIKKLADAIIHFYNDSQESSFSQNINAKRQNSSFDNIRTIFEEIHNDLKKP
jgi:glycosyltransferase involved in cell wall biosynthesis